MKLTERQRVLAQNTRARAFNTTCTLTVVEWEQTVQDFNGMCAYCLVNPFTALEHFIPFGNEGDGTHVKNCLPACQPCNNLKKARNINILIQKFGLETIERLQAYLAQREYKADPPLTRKQRPLEPKTAEERKTIKLENGINGREPEPGDRIRLQGENGYVFRTVDRVLVTYLRFDGRDYKVSLLPRKTRKTK